MRLQPWATFPTETARCFCLQGDSLSVLDLIKGDNHARRFRSVRCQTGECRVAPVGKTYNLAGLHLRFPRLSWFQNLKSTLIQKERVVPKHIGQLRDRRMVIWKNLGIQ